MSKSRLSSLVFAGSGAVILLTFFFLSIQVNTAASTALADTSVLSADQLAVQSTNSAELAAPAIQFTKTVGTSPTGCATTDTIDVVGPTTIIYCYAVKNTGDVTFTRNTLIEGGIGPLINNVFLRLGPGDSTYFTLTTSVTQTTVTTASWNAYDVASYTIDANAPYNFIDISSTGTPLVLGTNGAINVTIPFNTQIFDKNDHHHRVGMNGAIKISSFDGSINAVNDPLPTDDFRYAIAPFWDDLDNDAGGVYAQVFGNPPNRSWVVQWNNVPHSDNVGAVTFQSVITEGVTSILFQYADVEFGVPAWDGGNSATIGVQKDSSTAVTHSFNTATLTNNMAIRFDPVFITASDSHTATVNVTPLIPEIAMTKTVGLVPGVCGPSNNTTLPIGGGDVYYCYEVRNTGNVTLSLHDLVDDGFGSIFTAFPFVLAPGESLDTVSAGLTLTQFISQTAVYTATWTAYNPGPADITTAVAATTVTVESPFLLFMPAVTKAAASTIALIWLIPLLVVVPALSLLIQTHAFFRRNVHDNSSS